jgi:hydrophobic/amphiphilic exporter-1 (mainly G- bacteria), HAE1 family
MLLSDLAIKRPVATSCVIIAIALLGLNSGRKMGLELMPKVDIPFITVTTIYPGATPGEIETDIAKRIEDQVVSIDGLKHVSSACMENVCQTMLEFELGVDVDIAATDVREKIDLIRSEFPVDVEDPQILKYDINAKPVVTLALAGDLGVDALFDYADNTLRDRLSVMMGVADVILVGGAEREVNILLDRHALAARGLTSADVVRSIQGGIRTIPSGRLRDGGTEYNVKFKAEYDEISDIAGFELVSQNGHRCYVRDVGEVVMGTEELRQIAEVDGRPAIAIKVVKKADANAVAVVRRVRESVEEIKHNLPGGMEVVWVTDDQTFTEAMNANAWINVAEGVLLTGVILFFFLYNIRALFVVVITMPLTIIIGLFFMQALDFTLNVPTLIAVAMSVGILVTNSIVVLEAIVKHLDRTGDPARAARQGAAESFIPVLASAVTNIVVLLPIAMMSSLLGILVHQFAVTMLIMTIVSLFISFTLTPMLCALLLRPRDLHTDRVLNRMERGWNRGLEATRGAYGSSLAFLERRRWAALLVVLTVMAMLAYAVQTAGKLGAGFGADSDRGEVYLKLEFPTHYGLSKTHDRVSEIQSRFADMPHLRHTLTTIGKVEGLVGQSSEGVHLAQVLLRFTEKTERDLSIHELMDMARERLRSIPDLIATVSIPTPIGGQGADIELEIMGPDLAILDRLALDTQAMAETLPGVTDPDTTVRRGKPELRVEPRRAVLSDLHRSATDVGVVLRANIEGIEAGTFKQRARNYDIIVKLREEEGKDQVREFAFPGSIGRPLTLATLARISEHVVPVQIVRKDKERVSKLFAGLSSGTPLGIAVEQLSQSIDNSNSLPPGYRYSFTGLFEKVSEANVEMAEAGIIALILVFLTLAAILESFKQPLLILVTIPLTVIGVIGALAMSGNSLEFFVLMSCVMMIGIVVNNAILIMDQFNVHVAEGVPRHKAMIAAATERFRPVVMITLAAVLGMLPLAFGRGMGAELRNAAGMASAGGILVSGILTLIVMPVLYDLFTHRSNKGG